jgi:WD repeat-containing protein 22
MFAYQTDAHVTTATLQHHFPTLYALSDPHPLAICSGKNLPDGTPTSSSKDGAYVNSCTIKVINTVLHSQLRLTYCSQHGSFGGPGLDSDQFYCAGSEDFRAYVWKVPELSKLAERRIEISSLDWSTQEWADVTGKSLKHTVLDVAQPQFAAFSEGTKTPRYVPVDLSTPLFRLTGKHALSK